MSKIIVNLSVICSIVLCALCLYQWRGGNLASREERKLTNDVYTNKVLIQGLEVTLKATKEEVDRLSKLRTSLESDITNNLAEIKGLTNELIRVIAEKDAKQTQLDTFKAALEQANAAINQQNESITKQNETLKAVAAQRDQQVEQYKKLADQYNETVSRYNQLVEDVKKQNAILEEMSKAASGQKKESSAGASGSSGTGASNSSGGATGSSSTPRKAGGGTRSTNPGR
jgi:chromosome segregation ATPase